MTLANQGKPIQVDSHVDLSSFCIFYGGGYGRRRLYVPPATCPPKTTSLVYMN